MSEMENAGTCSIEDCHNATFARGWCCTHYNRWLKHGSPLAAVRRHAGNGTLQRFFREVVLTHEGEECLTWPFSRFGNGYASMKHNGRNRLVHRVVCEHFNGPPPTPRHEVAHSCGKGHEGCVAPAHLRWATPAQNQGDRLRHGTHSRGERSGLAKLTEAEVYRIIALRGSASQREIAEMYGVSQSTIGDIQRREKWTWLS